MFDDIELSVLILLLRCLEVKTKIEQVMSNNAHLGPSLFRALPRTVSSVLRTTWDAIIADENPKENLKHFEVCICSFIASHSTTEDHHELTSQLQSPHKPREIKFQSLCCEVREVNGFVIWLPGNEPRLNEDQLKQAFFDSTPLIWHERLESAGHAISAMTLAEVLRCFRQQEKLATRKQIENERTQRRASKQNKTRTNSSVDI